MKRAIVTGACGFVGSSVVKKLIENGIEVLCLDVCYNEKRLPKSKLIKFAKVSVSDINSLKDKINKSYYDTFFHFAWKGSAGELRSNAEIQTENALETLNCLKFADSIGCDKFVCAGSIMEFETNSVVYKQETKPNANYIYGAAKAYSHLLCKAFASKLNIKLVWAYITNAYGVGELSPRFVNSTLRKIISGFDLEFTAATQNYDFLYIDDVANAFYLLGLKGKANKGYIIGSGNAKPLKEFIYDMVDANCFKGKVVFGNIPFTGENLELSTFCIDEITNDCGFKPTISFGEGTLRTRKWLEEMEK